MKPTSIIFLILAVILTAAGIALCFTASRLAEDQNIELFDTVSDSEANTIERHAFNDYGVSRIILKLSDVDVNIIGNTESSYVELVNFTKNTFDYTVSAKTMTVDNTIGLFSIFNFTESGFEFNGLRHYILLNQFKDKPKTVNIYINPNETVKIFDIEMTGGNLHVEGLKKRADYNITLDSGDIDLLYVNTSSSMSVKLGTGDVRIISDNLNSCLVNIKRGDFAFYNNYFVNQEFTITAPKGDITVAGESKGTEYTVKSPIAAARITAELDDGSAVIAVIPEQLAYVTPNIPPYSENPTSPAADETTTAGETTAEAETSAETETTAQ